VKKKGSGALASEKGRKDLKRKSRVCTVRKKRKSKDEGCIREGRRLAEAFRGGATGREKNGPTIEILSKKEK